MAVMTDTGFGAGGKTMHIRKKEKKKEDFTLKCYQMQMDRLNLYDFII